MIELIAWLLIVMVVVNLYFVWHGYWLNSNINPRSPVMRALLYTKTSIWLLGVYFAIAAYRYLTHADEVLPFGGIGLGVVILYVLTVPAFIHSQMVQFLDQEQGDTP